MKTIIVAEFKDIPTGISQFDNILKNFNLEIYKAAVTCPGKYFFILYGDNESIKDATESLENLAKVQIISGVSEEIVEVLSGKSKAELKNSIGIVEFWNIPDSVKSLDLVLKSTNVKILKLVLGWGTAGKSYYVITGDTSSVEEAVVLVTGLFKYKDKAVVNNPYEGILKHI